MDQQPKRPPGRPPGTTKPDDQKLTREIRVAVTEAQHIKFLEQIGSARLRQWVDRYKAK
jgi:hypothetical protein